jgi:hypothetical protein
MPTTISGTTITTTAITGSSINLTGGSQGFVTPTSGSAPYYGARAFVNFNGTGTVAIRSAGNVSSITDLGTGIYLVNFTTAMPDTNYTLLGTSEHDAGTSVDFLVIDGDVTVSSPSASSVRINIITFQGSARDSRFCNVAIFR